MGEITEHLKQPLVVRQFVSMDLVKQLDTAVVIHNSLGNYMHSDSFSLSLSLLHTHTHTSSHHIHTQHMMCACTYILIPTHIRYMYTHLQSNRRCDRWDNSVTLLWSNHRLFYLWSLAQKKKIIKL